MRIISVRACPQSLDRMIRYFQEKWASETSRMVYDDCIRHAVSATAPLPQWYLLAEGNKTIGCAGLITNDFISRMDLYPWLCALYIEPEHRGHAYSGLLIERAKADARAAGFPYLYLCSDHVGFYEKVGFDRIGTGYHPWGVTSGIFHAKL